MYDYISKKEVINYARKCADGYSYIELPIDAFVDGINALPSAELPKGDLISRADVLKYPIRLDHYDEVNGNRQFVYGVESVIEYVEALPSADIESDDLIIKGAKGIQDGLYNITDGKLYKYKANGGTVRTYPIVPSADRPQGEWEHWGSPFSDESEVIDTIVCSVCGARFFEPKDEPKGEYNYCPNCGAIMKGGENE